MMKSKRINLRAQPGSALKQRRVDLGYSLDEAAQASGIPQRTIHLLETEQLDRLPTFLYVKAFLERYCAFLKMPCDAITAGFELKLNREKIQTVNQYKDMHARRVKSPSINPRRLSIAGVVFLFATLGVYALWQSSFLFRAPQLTIESPADNMITFTDEIIITGSTDPQAIVTLNNEQIFVEPTGVFTETVLLNEGVNTLTIIASSRFGNQKTRVIRVTYRPATAPN